MIASVRLAALVTALAFPDIAASKSMTEPISETLLSAKTYLTVDTTASPNFTAKTLSPSIEIAREYYLDEGVPLFFLIEKNGEYASWWMCESKDDCNIDEQVDLAKAKSFCEARMLGATCFLDMRGTSKFKEQIPRAKGLDHRVLQANGTTRSGPRAAKGKVFYFPGFGGWSWSRPNFWRLPGDAGVSVLFLALNEKNWDVDVVNIAHHDRYRLYDSDEDFAALGKKLIREAKAEGYERVAFGGTSRGGNEILNATRGGARPDSILLFEPDGLGPSVMPDGSTNENEEERAAVLIEGLSNTADIPTSLVFFASSRWFGDLSAANFASLRKTREAPFALLARPEGYSGHSGAGTDRFAVEYAECFDTFLTTGEADFSECRNTAIDDSKPAMWATRTHLDAAGLSPATARQHIGAVFCDYNPKAESRNENGPCVTFTEDARSFSTWFDIRGPHHNIAPAIYNETGYCKRDLVAFDVEDVCYSVYPFEDKILIVRDGTDDLSWYIKTDLKALPKREWICTSSADDYDCKRAAAE